MAENAPHFAPCEVTVIFVDGNEYTLKLTLKMIAELQRKCESPIGEIYQRVVTGSYDVRDVVETTRLALVGGGKNAIEVKNLIDTYCDDNQMPLDLWHKFAYTALAAAMHGYQSEETEETKKPKG